MTDYQTTVPRGAPPAISEPKRYFARCPELDALYYTAKHCSRHYPFETSILVETTLLPTRIEVCGMIVLLEGSSTEGKLRAYIKITRANLDELARQGDYAFTDDQIKVIGSLCNALLEERKSKARKK